jgi:hypothetical protein
VEGEWPEWTGHQSEPAWERGGDDGDDDDTNDDNNDGRGGVVGGVKEPSWAMVK